MVGHSATASGIGGTTPTLVTLVSEGSATHRFVYSLRTLDNAASTRSATDMLHHLCMLHGRHPGVIDRAASRTASDAARVALFSIADDFALERELLARLVVAAGPIPSTPGQAETEASVIAQRHAIDMLAQSDRQGCAIGAGLALALDWHAVRPVIDAAARRFGVEVAPSKLPAGDRATAIASEVATTPGIARAMLFGAQQIVIQHLGLWDLLEARAAARGHD